jgi:carboxylate-amine ligase
MAIVALVIETIKALVSERFLDFESQMKWKTDFLAQLLDKTSENAQQVVIDNKDYLNVFGYPGHRATVVELWRHITERIIRSGNVAVGTWRREIDVILSDGTLSQRIVRALGKDHSKENITVVYKHLCDCLAQNRMFLP